MKVLHVISGLSQGGAEATLCRLVAHARSVRHEVLVLSDIRQLDGALREAGASISYVDLKQLWRRPWRLWMVYRCIAQSRPDVVQTWMYHADVIGGLCARWAGVKRVVWSVHHACPDSADLSPSARLFSWLSKEISGWLPDRILMCSQTSWTCHARYGYAAVMAVARNGYDTAQFHPDRAMGLALRRELGLPTSTRLLGMVARYHPIKGHAIFLAALQQLRARKLPFRCLLVGDGTGPGNASLTALIDRLGLQEDVVLMGPRSDMPEVMNALDVLVLSSLSEAFPNVLNEAMACGTPCVTTDVGDARYIVGETGWVVPPGEVDALANAMAQALEASIDTDAWARRQQQARQRIVEHFSVRRMVDAYQAGWLGEQPSGTGEVA